MTAKAPSPAKTPISVAEFLSLPDSMQDEILRSLRRERESLTAKKIDIERLPTVYFTDN